jgi:CRP-like cAMP-binding protein
MRFAPFGRGEVITRQGSMAHWLYVLVKGQVEVRVRAEPEGEKAVARLDAPDVFGEMGVVTGEPRTASVLAATDVECYRIDRETFQILMARRQDLAAHISEVMAKRRVELAAVLDHLDAEGRVRRAEVERSRLLRALQSFFGMGDEK